MVGWPSQPASRGGPARTRWDAIGEGRTSPWLEAIAGRRVGLFTPPYLLRIPARSERERENAAEGLRTNPYQGWFVGISGTKVQLGMLTYIWRDHYETTLHPPARAAERFNYAGSLFGFEV